MTDLVKRLRELVRIGPDDAQGLWVEDHLHIEAADRIEQLEEDIELYRSSAVNLCLRIEQLETERERIRNGKWYVEKDARIEELETRDAQATRIVISQGQEIIAAKERIEQLEKRIEFLLEERALLTKGVPILDLRNSSSTPDGSSQSHSEHEQDAT